jgi:hypothetical protein
VDGTAANGQVEYANLGNAQHLQQELSRIQTNIVRELGIVRIIMEIAVHFGIALLGQILLR